MIILKKLIKWQIVLLNINKIFKAMQKIGKVEIRNKL